MSILAGAYSLRKGAAVPADLRRALSRAVSRNEADDVRTLGDGPVFAAFVDVGAFGDDASLASADGSFSLLAGEILLSDGSDDRREDLESVIDDPAKLIDANGVFSLVHHDAASNRLIIATDKLGIRPVYFWRNDDILIFASALRILEAVPTVAKHVDLRAVTEIAGLGYPLADRTPYLGISLLNAGEALHIADDIVDRRQYWNWNDRPVSAEPEERIVKGLYDRFTKAVGRRLRGDTASIAYLSGGLDSRCVVDAIRSRGAQVHTFNFARKNTQDLTFGRLYAEKAGVIHTESPKAAGDLVPDYSTLMAQAWKASPHKDTAPVERSQLIWSGEGGSVDLGHVHLGRRLVELMRTGREDEAIDEFISRDGIYIPPMMIRTDMVGDPHETVRSGVREELLRISAPDPARRFYLFLMLNDQRRKLARHFENLDLHRLEFQLPFFDSSFVELIVSTPVDLCLEHKLYTKWLRLFPNAADVPWQAYPGHVPCPLPAPDGLAYQWDVRTQVYERDSLKRKLLGRARHMITATNFPGHILHRRNIMVAAIVYAAGLRDYGYVLETAATYYELSTKGM